MKKYAPAGTKRISLEQLRKVLGLESTRDADGNIYPTSAITGLGELPPASLGYGDQWNQRQDRLAHPARVAGAIRASPGHSGDFCD